MADTNGVTMSKQNVAGPGRVEMVAGAGSVGAGGRVIGNVLEHRGTGLTLGLSAGLGFWADYAGGQFNDALTAWVDGDVDRAIELALYAGNVYEAIGQDDDARYCRDWAGV
jgi:hypothetical protein